MRTGFGNSGLESDDEWMGKNVFAEDELESLVKEARSRMAKMLNPPESLERLVRNGEWILNEERKRGRP